MNSLKSIQLYSIYNPFIAAVLITKIHLLVIQVMMECREPLEHLVHLDQLDRLEFPLTHHLLAPFIQDGGELHVIVMLYFYIKVRDSSKILVVRGSISMGRFS